jgi:choline dehydrogenase-like flavoprotein
MTTPDTTSAQDDRPPHRYPSSVDVAIVGSGPTGAAFARILAERAPDARVAMFEAGPTVTAPAGAHVKNITNPDSRAAAQRASEGPGPVAETLANPGAAASGRNRARPGTFLLGDGAVQPGEDGLPVAAMSSNVGGMSAHWTGACPRPQASERIDFLPELDELLADAERLLGVTAHAFSSSPYTEAILSRLSDAVDQGRPESSRAQRMPLAAHRRADGALVWSGSDVVLGDVTRENTAFTLHDESLVTRVLIEDGQASGIQVLDRRSGLTHSIAARYVVVAGDAIRTPQLLWASGIRPNALGRYLNDQTQIVFAVRIDDVDAPAAVESTTALSESSGVNWVPFTDESPFHVQVMQLDASPVALADDDPAAPGSIVGLGLFCAKDLQREDRVAFDENAVDAYGMPAPRIHYRLTHSDRAVLERGRSEILRLGAAIGTPLNPAPFTMPLGASLHYQGSTRMGTADNGESVCDPTSQVWGTPGLFVAGNGVIPTATACNPTLTSVALAIGGARRLASELATTKEKA